MNEIFTRRSVRKFLEKDVENEKIEMLLKAAMQAPSRGNQQPWEFIVVTEKDLVLKLSNFSRYSKLLVGAPVAIVVLMKKNCYAPSHAPQDLGACVENLLLQAVSEGLGTCWMGAGTGDDRDAFLIDMFNLPETVVPYGVIAVGYPAEEGMNKFVDRYNESLVHYNKY